jgi:uncharacterized protein involved in exopolysaccharide biosynthesis
MSSVESPQRLHLATNGQQTVLPPRIEPFTALRRHWFLALFPVALFVAGAVVLGMKRPPRYTTTANLSVGHIYVNNPAGIPSIVDATQSLAAVYSRAIHSTPVARETRRILLKDRSGPVSGDLSATPLPDSPLIKVSAESSSESQAIALANAGATALATYVNGQVRDNGASAQLTKRYRAASLRYRQQVDMRNRLNRRYARHPTRATKAARDRASAAADTALLQREALRASYETAVQGGSSSAVVEVFSYASAAKSDRTRKMQLFIFVGLLGGLASGTALALLRASRDIRRRNR